MRDVTEPMTEPTTEPTTGSPVPTPDAVVDALPGAVLVIDASGTVRYASGPAAEQVGQRPGDLTGRSVLEFVTPESAWTYASSMALSTDYPDTIMGPLRITFLDHLGRERRADVWSTNHLDDPEIGGIVCFLSEESAASGMADAVTAIAMGRRREALRHVVEAMRGHPVVARAVLLVAGVDAAVPFDDTDLPPALAGRGPGPWEEALAGSRVLHEDLSRLDPGLADAAAEVGFAAVWAEPVRLPGRKEPLAALVLWRSRPGIPSPNQLAVLFEGASLAALALTATE